MSPHSIVKPQTGHSWASYLPTFWRKWGFLTNPHGFFCGITGVFYGMLRHLSLIYSQQRRKRHLGQHGNPIFGWNGREASWGLAEWIWCFSHSGDLLSPAAPSYKSCVMILLTKILVTLKFSSFFRPLLVPVTFGGWFGLGFFCFVFCVMNLFLNIRAAGITRNAMLPCKNVSCNKRNLEPAWQPGSCYRMKSEPQLVSTWHQTSS